MNFENALYINTCNLLGSYGEDCSCNRPRGRKDWHILYITAGKCFVTLEEKVVECPPGTVLIYPNDVPQKYSFRGDIKSKYFYIHFDGDWCKELLGNYNDTIYFIGKNAKLEELFFNLVDDFALRLAEYKAFSSGLLLSIISVIKREIAEMQCSAHSAKNRVVEVCRQMQANFNQNISIGEYAAMCNLSESRFSHLFKERMYVSPMQYLTDIRMQKAKQLLENTDLSIAAISEMVGAQSQHYFCKMFKKYTMMAPSKYRENMQ